MKRSTAGFTLIELLVTILCTSVVTLAAMSFLLLGMRMTGESNDTAGQQETARILLTMVENLAGSGELTVPQPQDDSGWTIRSSADSSKKVLCYSPEEKKITSGGGTVLMDGVEGATVTQEKQPDDTYLLKFEFQTEKGRYATSVYCRLPMADPGGETEDAQAALAAFRAQISEAVASNSTTPGAPAPAVQAPASVPATERGRRLALLAVLAGQHGSTGEIIGQTAGEYQYFSEWYIGGYGDDKPGWNADTPWCACFVSWAAAQLGDTYLSAVPRFCNVDDGMEQFRSGAIGTWHGRGYAPTPGDCIFFDWTGGDDPAHVGVVFYVDGAAGTVYTIEGNSSGRVAVRSYARDDPCILGYGELKWK